MGPGLARWLATPAFDPAPLREGDPTSVRVTPWHLRTNGETDLFVVMTWTGRERRLHIEDKIDAPWSRPASCGATPTTWPTIPMRPCW